MLGRGSGWGSQAWSDDCSNRGSQGGTLLLGWWLRAWQFYTWTFGGHFGARKVEGSLSFGKSKKQNKKWRG